MTTRFGLLKPFSSQTPDTNYQSGQ